MQGSRTDQQKAHDARWLAERTMQLSNEKKTLLLLVLSVWWLSLWLKTVVRSPVVMVYASAGVAIASTTINSFPIILAVFSLSFLAMVYGAFLALVGGCS